MLKRNRKPTHPGVILKEHYLVPRMVPQNAFADDIEITEKHLSRIVNGKARIEPDVAARIAKALDTTVDFWLNLQARLDAWKAVQVREAWKPKVVYRARRAEVVPA